MRYRRNDQQEVEPSKGAWSKTAGLIVCNLLQETLGSDALERLDLFDQVQLANVVEVVSISRALSRPCRALPALKGEEAQLE